MFPPSDNPHCATSHMLDSDSDSLLTLRPIGSVGAYRAIIWQDVSFLKVDIVRLFPCNTSLSTAVRKIKPAAPDIGARVSYSLYLMINEVFPDGVPESLSMPQITKELTERSNIAATRGIKKGNLKNRKHDKVIKTLLGRAKT